MTVTQDECDMCGDGSPSDGLRLCAICEAWERACHGDIGLLGEVLAALKEVDR